MLIFNTYIKTLLGELILKINAMKKSKYTWLLDAGHGGIIDGEYQTAGKRSPEFEFGQYFEGVGNRMIVKNMLAQCKVLGIDAIDIVDSDEDISLKERVKRANNLHTQKKNCIYVSIHSDAFSNPQANGYSIYTSVGNTASDGVATTFIDTMREYFPDHTSRHDNSDGDADKEAQFYVLKYTSCPAILIENFFYTNPKECELLLDKAFQDKIASCHMDSIKRIER
tara:strand:+ start:682 stop:1356 length:675 start_codon:yes stop_codon:yes gene_type:complete